MCICLLFYFLIEEIHKSKSTEAHESHNTAPLWVLWQTLWLVAPKSFIVTYSLIFSTKKAERLENLLFQIVLQLGVAFIELQLMEYMYVYLKNLTRHYVWKNILQEKRIVLVFFA